MPLYGPERAENGWEVRQSWFGSSVPHPPYLEPLECLEAVRAGPSPQDLHRLSTDGERGQNFPNSAGSVCRRKGRIYACLRLLAHLLPIILCLILRGADRVCRGAARGMD